MKRNTEMNSQLCQVSTLVTKLLAYNNNNCNDNNYNIRYKVFISSIDKKNIYIQYYTITRCTRSVRVIFFFRARMRSSNSARMNKSNVTTEKSCAQFATLIIQRF